LHGLRHLDGVDSATVGAETIFAIDPSDLAYGDQGPALSAGLAVPREHGSAASHDEIVGEDKANTKSLVVDGERATTGCVFCCWNRRKYNVTQGKERATL
jgi:hypothetical protein